MTPPVFDKDRVVLVWHGRATSIGLNFVNSSCLYDSKRTLKPIIFQIANLVSPPKVTLINLSLQVTPPSSVADDWTHPKTPASWFGKMLSATRANKMTVKREVKAVMATLLRRGSIRPLPLEKIVITGSCFHGMLEVLCCGQINTMQISLFQKRGKNKFNYGHRLCVCVLFFFHM